MVNGNETEIQPIVQSRCDGDGQACSDLAWRNAGVLRLTVDPAAAVEHGVEQHIAASGDVFGQRVFDFVVADAVLARHEDHRRRRHPADIAGVVARTAHDVHVRIARLLRPAAYRLDQLPRERRRREVPDLLDLHVQAMAPGDVGCGRAHFDIHLRQFAIVGMTEVDRHEDAARNRVTRLRLALDHAAGRAAVRAVADLAKVGQAGARP